MKESAVVLPASGVLKITSHMLDTLETAVLAAKFRRVIRSFALLPALPVLVGPTAAWGDVYKWTDEKGITCLSDVLPKPGEKVKNFEVVAKAARPETKVPAQAATPTEQALLGRIQDLNRQLQLPQGAAQAPKVPPQAVTPAEQALLARVEMLERQLQAPQYAAPAPAVPPPTTYGSDYPPGPLPPAPSSGYYDSGYDSSGYDSSYYPSYYPSYSYPVVAAYSYPVFRIRPFINRPVFLSRPAFISRPVSAAPHGGSFRGGGGQGGGGRGGRR